MNPDHNIMVLEVLKQEDGLKTGIFEQKEVVPTVRNYTQVRISWEEIDRLCQEEVLILNQADKAGLLDQESAGNLKKIGQLLWDNLFSRQVKDKLKSAGPGGLILSLDEELISIPWELLYDGADFLCLKFSLGRLVRTKQNPDLPEYRSLNPRLRMLILANPTNDLKSSYSEGLNIKNQFDRKRKQVSIDFKSTSVDTFYVKKNLRDYDIVHFAGHCEYDAGNPKNSGWLLEDARFTARDILTLGEAAALPALVFSNACYSAKALSGSLDTHYQRKSYSLASAFLFSGVRHYIGTIRKIEDKASLIFAEEFYSRLIYGKTVGESLRLARMKLIREFGIASIFWASYLLYGDPNFSLFKDKVKLPLKIKLINRVHSHKKVLYGIILGLILTGLLIFLHSWLPTMNPGTYLLSIRSQRMFNQGRNEEAILASNRIIKQDPEFIAAYSLLGDTYQRQGRFNQALKYYFDYAAHSQKRNDKNNLAAAYLKIGWLYQQMGEYVKAFDFYNKALSLSLENKDKLNQGAALRKMAVWHMDKDDNNKALELLMKSSQINQDRQFLPGHRFNLACDYFDIGLVFTNKDDFVSAREFYGKSLKLFERMRLKHELSDYYFNLGEMYLIEKQHQKALDCYSQGLKIDQAQGNLPSIAADYNMIGELYLDMDNLKDAQECFNQAVSVALNTDDR
ncbi:MAG: CHAT domain-containing protein, partial [Candidatus Omnitrophica bacterium]|nr:CHAT domain-containing protein [Candidatus Omnitrophota bacterium]